MLVTSLERLPAATFPLAPSSDNHWSGRFPLRGSGLYRVDLRNELDHPNRAMQEAKFHAVPDQPPQIEDPRLLDFAGSGQLIIFDSLIRFHGSDENSAKEMSKIMGHLRALTVAGAPGRSDVARRPSRDQEFG